MSSAGKHHNICVLISGNGTNLQALIDACGQQSNRQNFPTTTSQAVSTSTSTPTPVSSSITPDSNPSTDRTTNLRNARISHVVSNRKKAYGLTRAEQAGIPTTYHNLLDYKRRHAADDAGVQTAREEYDRKLAAIITSLEPRPDLVVCAGWMHILSPAFFDEFTTLSSNPTSRSLPSASTSTIPPPSPLSPPASTSASASAPRPQPHRRIPIINLHPALPGAFDGADAITRAWAAFQRGDIESTGVMIHEVIPAVDQGPVVAQEVVHCSVGESESELEQRIHQVEWGLIVKGVAVMLQRIEDDAANDDGTKKR